MKTQKNKTTTKTKTNKKKRNTHKTKQKIKKRLTPFFRMIFHMHFTCFFIKISQAQSIYIIETMLSVKCHLFIKANVFFVLFKAISFSILLTFWISAMRLIKFMNFFSLDL